MASINVGDWNKLGGTLRDARRARGFSQHDLAARAGVSRAWLARFEGGHRRAEIEQVFRLLKALDLALAVKPVERSSNQLAVLAALARKESP